MRGRGADFIIVDELAEFAAWGAPVPTIGFRMLSPSEMFFFQFGEPACDRARLDDFQRRLDEAKRRLLR